VTAFDRGGANALMARRHGRSHISLDDGSSPLLRHLLEAAEAAARFQATGEVVRVIGTTVEAAGLILQLGSICWIDLEPEGMVSAEVVGFKDGMITLVPFGDLSGVRPGSAVRLREQQFRVPIGPAVLGRVLDGFGRPLDGQGPLRAEYRVVTGAAPHPLGRARISTPISTGVRALDGLLSAGKGQRLGIFAGSGVGKSTLLAMIARHASSNVNVIALIGERGREVQEFIDEQLGPEGLARSCVVVATSDQPALLRLKAAEIATAIAESFRDEGKDVLFMMDSVTRLAMAQREIGLGAGEPPALRGYPPSVFSFLPRLLERAGNTEYGTITGFFTVLVEGDDMTEPVADTVRSILDGHIVLSRALAERNHYPAIDVLASVSRAMPAVVNKEHMRVAGAVRAALAEYEGARDLIEVGAYAHGSNPAIDEAIALRPALEGFLCQDLEESSDIVAARQAMENCGVLNAHALLGPGAGIAAARPTDQAGMGRPGGPTAGGAAPVAPQPQPANPMPSIFRSEAPR
jgi:FliI/YscN family ATPase